MSNALTLARPYARAAFASAQEQSRVPQWSQQLAFAAQVALDPRVNTLLGHPRLQGETLTGLLTPPNNEDAGFARFLALLAENRRLPLLPEIAIGFAELRAEAERVVKVQIVSAAPLDDATLARMRESLRKRFGREVEMKLALDPELIGGAVIHAGDVVIDGSLRNKLSRMRAALAN